jgi:hypothetical protein
MDERKQQVGKLGGERTAQLVREADKQKEQAMEDATDIEIASPARTGSDENEEDDDTTEDDGSGETVSPKPRTAISTILFNLRELEEDLYKAISDAKGNGSHLLEIDFDENGLATNIRAVKKSKAAQAA